VEREEVECPECVLSLRNRICGLLEEEDVKECYKRFLNDNPKNLSNGLKIEE